MTIRLPPELERLVQEQVSSGRFESVDALVAAGVERIMLDGHAADDLTDEDVAAIDESERQIAAGQTLDFHAFAAELLRDLPAE